MSKQKQIPLDVESMAPVAVAAQPPVNLKNWKRKGMIRNTRTPWLQEHWMQRMILQRRKCMQPLHVFVWMMVTMKSRGSLQSWG